MNKSVFVTGGCYGTGYAVAERFAKEGYNVFISGRDKNKADNAAKAISEKYGVYAKGYQTSSFEQDEVCEIFADIEQNGYRVDSLVLNAANLGIGQESLSVNVEDFMGVYKINVAWNFMMAREAAKQMKKAGKGSIVFITSNSALRVTENRCAYCSSKSAILAMSKSFAVDWGKYGIRSNCVLPGMIKTERWENNVNNCKYYLANYTPKVMMKLNGVKYEKGLRLVGYPFVFRYPKAKLSLGGNCTINSNFFSNLIGLYQRTIIIARGEGQVCIGNNVGISGAAIYARERIEIGDNTLIGANTKIFDNDFHSLNTEERINNDYSNLVTKPVKIGKNCFIGCNAIILKGTVLGDNCIVGAGAVVHGKFEDNSVIAGNPAKLVKIAEVQYD